MKKQRLIDNVNSIFDAAQQEMYKNGKTPNVEDLKELEETKENVLRSIRLTYPIQHNEDELGGLG